MVSSLRKFSCLLFALTLALAALSLLPGAVDGAEAKSLQASVKHSKHHRLVHHPHNHTQLQHKKHKHKHSGKKAKSKANGKGKGKGKGKSSRKHRKHKHHKGTKKTKGKHSKAKGTKTKKKKHSRLPKGAHLKQADPNNLTPYGLKAGITGEDGLEALAPYIGSYSNWKPEPWSPEPPTDVLYMPMIWGAGQSSAHDRELLHSFKTLVGPDRSNRKAPPKVVIGFEEPDCPTGHGSSGVSVATGARVWNEVIGPLRKEDGTILVSPSMCKQTDEDWLTPFKEAIDVHWDVTNVHVNQDNVDDVKREIDYYWNKYKKPIYVTEFACVHVKPSWDPVTDQQLINRYIREIVDYFESDDRVMVYQYSTGMGLSDQWRLTKPGTKELTESGRVYRDAIKKYAGSKSQRVGVGRRSLDSDDDDSLELGSEQEGIAGEPTADGEQDEDGADELDEDESPSENV